MGGYIIHEAGTVSMGNDPKTSALNKYCQAHEVKNLFVCDAAPFVSNPDKNVTLDHCGVCVASVRISGRGNEERQCLNHDQETSRRRDLLRHIGAG